LTSEILDADQLRKLLREVGQELSQKGIRGELFIVGGAALALAYNTRRFTRDVDAVFEPKTEVYEAANRVGTRHGLPEGWINDAVKGLLPGPDSQVREVFSIPGLRVSVPSPRYLLALKVFAARVDRDSDDIRVLADLCGAHTAREVLNITEEVMGGRKLQPKSQYIVKEMFP
jgi:hypothetical protein